MVNEAAREGWAGKLTGRHRNSPSSSRSPQELLLGDASTYRPRSQTPVWERTSKPCFELYALRPDQYTGGDCIGSMQVRRMRQCLAGRTRRRRETEFQLVRSQTGVWERVSYWERVKKGQIAWTTLAFARPRSSHHAQLFRMGLQGFDEELDMFGQVDAKIGGAAVDVFALDVSCELLRLQLFLHAACGHVADAGGADQGGGNEEAAELVAGV